MYYNGANELNNNTMCANISNPYHIHEQSSMIMEAMLLPVVI